MMLHNDYDRMLFMVIKDLFYGGWEVGDRRPLVVFLRWMEDIELRDDALIGRLSTALR